MDGKYNKLELLFIEEILDQHGEYVVDLFAKDIIKKKLFKSEKLIDSLNYKTTTYGIDPVLLISFFFNVFKLFNKARAHLSIVLFFLRKFKSNE